jgi:alpha-galactosidase
MNRLTRAICAPVLLLGLLVGTGTGATAATGPTQTAQQQLLSPTPYMGWNTYFGLGGDFDENTIKGAADALVNRGLKAAGYDIVWLDGGWQAPTSRNEQGDLVADPAKFPSGMQSLVNYVHSLGLRAGIYTDAGPWLPASCGLGSGGHYQHDADQFAAWGFDAVKVDFLCGIAADLDPKTAFTEFATALRNNASHRPMIFNLCNPVTSPDWGDYPPEQQSTYSWSYAPEIAQSWRTYTDVGFQHSIKFSDVLRNYDKNAAHPEVAGPGHWNDPDYLGPELGMTTQEFRTQMTLWSVAAAPLIIGSDVRSLSQETVEILKDPEVVAINQDPAGVQATRVGPAGSTEVWVKRLADGGRAVVLLNRGDQARTILTTARDVGLRGDRFSLLDAWSNQRTETQGPIRAAVPAHGSALFRVEPVSGRPGEPHVTLGEPRVTAVNGTALTSGDGRTVVAAGDALRVEVQLFNDGTQPVDHVAVSLNAPAGWQVQRQGKQQAQLNGGRSATAVFSVAVPAAAEVGEAELSGSASYTVSDGTERTLASASTVTAAPAPPQGSTVLSHHPWFIATSGWMTPTVDASVGGGSPISIKGVVYATGVGVASPSELGYYLGEQCSRLTGTVGLDDAVRNVGPEGATAGFTVVGDGAVLFASGVLTRDDVANLDIDVTGVRVLSLLVDDGGDGGYNDRADWAELHADCA